MAVDLKYNKNTKKVTVTVTFDADAQVNKPSLEKSVITNHLLTQASALCAEAAANALNGPTNEAIDAEADERVNQILSEAARRKANKPTSDV